MDMTITANEITAGEIDANKITAGTWEYTVLPLPSTGIGTTWIVPEDSPKSRTLKVGSQEFTVHADGTVHIDPEAFVELLHRAGLN